MGFDEMGALGSGVPLAAIGSALEAHPFLLPAVCFILHDLALDLEPPDTLAPFQSSELWACLHGCGLEFS